MFQIKIAIRFFKNVSLLDVADHVCNNFLMVKQEAKLPDATLLRCKDPQK
jgi:hypothetical protein